MKKDNEPAALKVSSSIKEKWKKLAYKRGMKLYAYTEEQLEKIIAKESKNSPSKEA